ncbi:MAG: RagB/SusD family nutrient uptake outer membrane protein [Bacteroides sp.]|nr:RagB/SusD family nutrient uptake outer membrane protein [Bacteroides sp.]
MKRLIINILAGFAMASLLLLGCENLEPEEAEVYTLDDVKSFVNYAEGVLLTAYRDLPSNHSNFTLATACDDAVTNNRDAGVKNANEGGWTSNSNPFGVWNGAYESVLYINTFLEEMSNVEWWWKDDYVNKLYTERLKGEAFGLRAFLYFGLLQAHAGKGANGEMLGVPIVDHVLNPGDPTDYQVKRSSFNELVAFILADCDSAIALIPDRYVTTGDIYYNLAKGEDYTNRINGLAVRLLKTKTLLYAASPSYSDGTYTYQQVAEEAVQIMDLNGGLSEINIDNQEHLQFYSNDNVTADNNSHPEVFWYSYRRNINDWEENNYPPSWYGLGRTNPSQELVNAFPLENGIPVRESDINSSDPFSGRDPRLSTYIFYNGYELIRAGDTLTINTSAGSQDAMGSSDPNTTLTGYYLKKFMNLNVNVDPNVNSNATHYYVYARYTDVLLMFAEAANEALGPDGDIGAYTARNVINAIRNRAGITADFFVGIQDQAGLAEIIKNERRLEMCFENQRFWDLRRWGMTDVMAQAVNGVMVSADGMTYTYVPVENRNYQAYQIYGPVPYGETLKYEIIQNEGW